MGLLYNVNGSANQVMQNLRCARATWDFATHGGGASVTGIGLGVWVPKGAIVVRVDGSVSAANTLAGAGATLAINIGAVEVMAATAFNNPALVDADNHFSTLTKIAADSEVNVDSDGAAFTAGRYDIFVFYFMGTDI